MIDIHCHILPETDDGAKSWDIAQEMCRMAAADGIRQVVATPHANDTYAYDRARHASTLTELQKRAGNGVGLAFSLGCDFHLSYDNIQDALAHRERYVIDGTRYLLVEFSDFAIPPFVQEALMRMLATGLVPVITHPERNSILQRHPEEVLRLADAGCVVQLTANSLTGRWGETARKMSHWLLERDAVHVLASDAHDLKSRPPVLSAGREAVAKLCGQDVAQALVEGNPDAIVANAELPYFPAPVR